MMNKFLNNIDFFGLPLTKLSKAEISDQIICTVENKSKLVIYGYSFGGIYLLQKHCEVGKMASIINISLIDGRPLYWMCKALDINIGTSLSIPEAVFLCLNIADINKYSIFLFGGCEELNNIAVQKTAQKYNGISRINGCDGYFQSNNLADRIKLINENAPDILFIGISTPLKEEIVLQYREKLNAKIIIPCGGMIDVLAGKTKMSPSFIKRIGLASIYRVIQEPKRLLSSRIRIYLFVFFRFIPKILWVRIKNRDFNIIDYYSQEGEC